MVFATFFVDAQKLVEDMEKERRKLDKQLDLVQEKTKRAYLSQEILEAKMKVGILCSLMRKKNLTIEILSKIFLHSVFLIRFPQRPLLKVPIQYSCIKLCKIPTPIM